MLRIPLGFTGSSVSIAKQGLSHLSFGTGGIGDPRSLPNKVQATAEIKENVSKIIPSTGSQSLENLRDHTGQAAIENALKNRRAHIKDHHECHVSPVGRHMAIEKKSLYFYICSLIVLTFSIAA